MAATIPWTPLVPYTASISKTTFLSQTTAVAGAALARQFFPAAFRPTAKIFARLGCLSIAAPVELLRRVVISVADTLPMARVMLEGTAFSLPPGLEILLGLLAINVCIKIGVSVDVDINLPTAPVGAAPGVSPRSAERNACPKGKHGAEHVPGRIPGIGRVGRIRPRSINHCRIIGRDIHDLGTSRFDFNDLLLDDDFLLLCRFQITGCFRLGSKPLNSIHDLLLL